MLTAMQMQGDNRQISEAEKQRQQAERDIKETKAELSANEKKVNESLSALRQIEGEITVSEQEIATVQNQLNTLNANISTLEGSISANEGELKELREEYLKVVKKMRVARKEGSHLAFLFASKNFNDVRRRLRYLQEFSAWKDRRASEILNKVATLKGQRTELVQAQNDAAVALKREMAAKDKLTAQKAEREVSVASLRENSATLRDKLAKRQAESRKLSQQISALIAEEQAKEAKRKAEEERRAEEKRKAEEARRLAEEKAAAEKKAAEEKAAAEAAAKAQAAAEAKKAAEQAETKQTQTASKPEKKAETKAEKKAEPKAEKPSQASTKKETTKQEKATPKAENKSEYAEARKRQPRTSTAETSKSTASGTSSASATPKAFENMRGSLPKPVNGTFRIVSAFGVHPISPELPDIMDENLGIDAHVANGAAANAVFDGEVLKVYDRTNTPGFRNIVVVKHGDYITVYANLETVGVKSGQKVTQGQKLGTVGSDFDDANYGLIHFEVWKNQTHLNPADWIKM